MAKNIKYANFFDLINENEDKPVAGLFMTYGFDAELFEKEILPAFLCVPESFANNLMGSRSQIAFNLKKIPVTVVYDAHQYNGGKTFLYNLIPEKNWVFHPKCYLLLFPDRLRVIIGSCNLTKPGLCYNAETVWYTDIVKTENSGIVEDLQSILTWLEKQHNMEKDQALQEVLKFLYKCHGAKGFPRLITTIADTSPFSQFFSYLEKSHKQCKRLNIVSPFFESDKQKAIEDALLLKFAEKLFTEYKYVTLRIFFPAIATGQGNAYKVNVPIKIFKDLTTKYADKVQLYAINPLWVNNDGTEIHRPLHAKLLICEMTDSHKITLSGSINFTVKAMYSKRERLSNVEIGVITNDRKNFSLPEGTRIGVSDLISEEREENNPATKIFVEDVEFLSRDNCLGTLTIRIIPEQAVYPLSIYYQEIEIYASTECPPDKITISTFKLKKTMDIKVVCKAFTFFYPINILNKEEVVTDDLKTDIQPTMVDIIEYLAGRYHSIQEIPTKKITRETSDNAVSDTMGAYFKCNLQHYYKALGTLQQELEEPYYSELSFSSYLNSNLGLKSLLSFIIDEYKNNCENKVVTAKVEAFVFIVELENIIHSLKFQKDNLQASYKIKQLTNLMAEATSIRKDIYQRATGKIKKEYKLLLNAYELD